jgi:sec-independent protein translocase protein TatA
MGMPSGMEWFIVLAIVLLLFGGGKLAGVGKSLGTAITEFKSALRPDEEDKNAPAPTTKPE